MHHCVDDCFTQHFQRVLRNIYPFPTFNACPHRYISVEKCLGSIYQLLQGSCDNSAIGIPAGTNRLAKEDTHHFSLDEEELRLMSEKEDTGIGWHHLPAIQHYSTPHPN